MAAFRVVGDAVVVAVRLTPKADRDAIAGTTTLADGREVIQARVRALPADGAANTALVALMARTLGVPKSSVAVVSGQTQRVKQVRIAGDANAVAARLSALLSTEAGRADRS